MDFVPFEEAHIADAAKLVSSRQRRLCQRFRLLSANLHSGELAEEILKTLWQAKSSSGVAAILNGQLAGYMFGDVTEDELRGKALWIRPAGVAVAPSQPPDLIRDLYQTASQHWIEELGCYKHFVQVFATPEDMQPWEDLAFAREQAYAMISLENLPVETSAISNVQIRRADKGDGDIFRNLATIISGTQSHSPSWSPILPSIVEGMKTGYEGIPSDEDAIAWLAFIENEPVGFIAFYPPETSGFELVIPENCIELTIAGTVSAAQGKGVGKALVEHALGKVREMGFRVCNTDWHIPNLLSSRFWPRRGFEPVLYRMKRVIDERILDAQIESA